MLEVKRPVILNKAFEDKHKHMKDENWRLQEGDVLEIFGK